MPMPVTPVGVLRRALVVFACIGFLYLLYRTVFDMVDYARANPGKVTLNGSGLFVWGGRSVCGQACQGRNGQRLLPALRRQML